MNIHCIRKTAETQNTVIQDFDVLIHKIHEHIHYAFQPIVDINTGTVFGHEALLRGFENIGFTSIHALFDHAWELGILHQVDLILRKKAINSFSTIPYRFGGVLFFNLDVRCFNSPDYAPEQTDVILKEHQLPQGSLCFELSERHAFEDTKHVKDVLAKCRHKNFRISIDDYGRGYSQLKMLYDHQPEFIKIDRFFLHGIAQDKQKQLMVKAITQMAQALKIRVIAEGIENQSDLLYCQDIGCDLVQGYYIAKPSSDVTNLLGNYAID